jgi:hypothetical protein
MTVREEASVVLMSHYPEPTSLFVPLSSRWTSGCLRYQFVCLTGRRGRA